MRKEAVGADVDEFKGLKPDEFCCVKFKSRDMRILEEPRLFEKGDPTVKSDYYNLKNKVGIPYGVETGKFEFCPGATNKKGKATARYRVQTTDIDLVHNQIQEQLFAQLKHKHRAKKVACEQDTGFGTKIDIVVRSGSSYTFYELKTANTVKQ
jgi:hypothetical protein